MLVFVILLLKGTQGKPNFPPMKRADYLGMWVVTRF